MNMNMPADSGHIHETAADNGDNGESGELELGFLVVTPR